MTSRNVRVRSLAYRSKVRRQWYKEGAEVGAPCFEPGAWVAFSGFDLPSDEQADRLCEGCPLRGKMCKTYADTGDMMWGVINGEVRGRGTADEGGLEDV